MQDVKYPTRCQNHDDKSNGFTCYYKRGRLGIVPLGGGGVIHCVGALSPAQALGSWPSSKLPLFCFLMLVYQQEIYMSIRNI